MRCTVRIKISLRAKILLLVCNMLYHFIDSFVKPLDGSEKSPHSRWPECYIIFSMSINHHIYSSIDQSIIQLFNHSTSHTNNLPVNQSISRWMNRSSNQPVNRPTNPSHFRRAVAVFLTAWRLFFLINDLPSDGYTLSNRASPMNIAWDLRAMAKNKCSSCSRGQQKVYRSSKSSYPDKGASKHRDFIIYAAPPPPRAQRPPSYMELNNLKAPLHSGFVPPGL